MTQATLEAPPLTPLVPEMTVQARPVLPLLRPALSLVVTLLIIGTLRVFSQIYIMTNGGPAGASASVIHYVYEIGFSKYQLGYAGAISVMLFATILVVTLIQLRVFREKTW